MGFPFLTVRYEGEKTLVISQTRFLSNPDEKITDPPSSYNYRWYVPITLLVKTGNTQSYETHWMLSSELEKKVTLRGVAR